MTIEIVDRIKELPTQEFIWKRIKVRHLIQFVRMQTKMIRMFFALALVVGFASISEAAGPFRIFGRKTNTTSTSSNNRPIINAFLGSAQGVANHMASIGRIGHFGGNPHHYEGVGSGSSPRQAEMNCCYRQSKTPVDVGVARGSNGMWYACCRYN